MDDGLSVSRDNGYQLTGQTDRASHRLQRSMFLLPDCAGLVPPEKRCKKEDLSLPLKGSQICNGLVEGCYSVFGTDVLTEQFYCCNPWR